jgi:hypothetical protein
VTLVEFSMSGALAFRVDRQIDHDCSEKPGKSALVNDRKGDHTQESLVNEVFCLGYIASARTSYA